jgi:ligand-binding sensor domain-containing protein/two-component sensor histidine kinase
VTQMRALVVGLTVTLSLAAAAPDGTAGPYPNDPLSDYTIATWDEDDGLPAGRIRDLAQDADGYLWIATDGGLVRFDGVRFDAWATRVQPHLPSSAVRAVISARDGSLWLGIGGGKSVARIQGGALTLHGPADGLLGTYALSLVDDHAGTIWATTSQGLFEFTGTRWRQHGPEAGLTSGLVLGVFEDREHRLWVGTTTAVYRRDRAGEKFHQVDEISISSNVWQSFSQDAAGNVWISDFKEGFRRPGVVASRGTRQPRKGWGVQLLSDSRGNFWVGTQGQGLWRVSDMAQQGESGVRAITLENGLASNAVQSMIEDREGNIWLGTLAGLQRLSPHRVTPVRNLPIPRAIATTPDGSVWVGTAAGLTRFSKNGRYDYSEADGLPGSLVLALSAGPDGVLWIATERGVGRFADERFSPLLVRPGQIVHGDQRIQRVVGLSSSRDGVWLRDFSFRVFQWRDGVLTQVTDVPDVFRRGALSTFGDRHGNLWIGVSDGSVGVRAPDGRFHSHPLSVGRVLSFFEDASGAVWAGGDDGLVRFSGNERLIVTRQNGLFGNIRSIVEDQHGVMWLGAGTGILRVEKSEIEKTRTDPHYRLRYRLFNTTDGVAGVPFSEGGGSVVRSKNKGLWFLTSGGVTVVDPDNIGPPRRVLVPRIETLSGDSIHHAVTGGLLLPAKTSHVQITFNALTLADPIRVRFRYRLEGFDRDWVDSGAIRQATYTNLPPRQYKFRVSATGGDGTWSEPGAILEFGVAPMFYQTRWFFALCVLLVVLLVYAAWDMHVRQVRRRFAMVLAERIRMSRAIHDTLLQGLAALALQVDDLSHHLDAQTPESRGRVLKIRRQVEEYIRQARRSIWDLRSPILDARPLSQALRETTELAIAGRPVEFDVTVTGSPPTDMAKVDEQLLLIGQEAVNNAIQHGQARRVALALEYHEDAVRLDVRDDGCGFDPAQKVDGHYGLISMRERAEQVRGRLTIASAPGRGTHIQTVVPTS